MTFARKYESWEIRQYLRSAEGAPSPVTTVGAHARKLHGMTPTGGTTAAFRTNMLDRVTKKPTETKKQFTARGGTPQTSAFANLLFQSAAVLQAFNSSEGQAALAVLDDPTHAGKSLRLTLFYSGINEAGFGEGTEAPEMLKAQKNVSALATVPGAAGVCIIVDRGSGTTEPFIQTCYPLDVPAASRWSVAEKPSNTVVASG